MVETLVALITALALIVVVPGPNTVAVVVASARRRRAGLFTALGVSTGDAAWASAALRWTYEHAAELGVDAAPLGVGGAITS